MKTVVMRPIFTEKSMSLANSGWYTFEVAIESNRAQITKVIENAFKVHVVEIRTITVKGKSKKTGKKRIEVAASSWKKALVKLAKNEKIELFNITQTTPTKV